MSKLRTTVSATAGTAPSRETSFYMIRDSVKRCERLIFGKLHAHGDHCAIGAFFHDNPKLSLYEDIIDEVAAYNDSFPEGTSERTRRNEVLKWLNFKLRVLQGLNPLPRRTKAKA